MTIEAEIHKGDVGTIFRATIYDENDAIVDVSSATTKTLYFTKPDGTLSAKTASFYTDGTDGIIQYETEDGFLDTIGSWKVQGYVVFGATNKYRSNIHAFKVHRNLE